MSVSHPTIMAEGTYSKPDGDLAAIVDGYGNFEIQTGVLIGIVSKTSI